MNFTNKCYAYILYIVSWFNINAKCIFHKIFRQCVKSVYYKRNVTSNRGVYIFKCIIPKTLSIIDLISFIYLKSLELKKDDKKIWLDISNMYSQLFFFIG